LIALPQKSANNTGTELVAIATRLFSREYPLGSTDRKGYFRKRFQIQDSKKAIEIMAIQTCPKCGTKNRVDEFTARIARPVCGKCGTELPADAAGKPKVVTDATFASDVIAASDKAPVLVDAWAEWCGPCRMIAPALDQLAAESQGRYQIAKLNVDENPQTAGQFGIRSIPTLLIFKKGKVVDQIIGAVPKQTIASRLAAQI
jgi:thioredoxin